MKIFRSAIILFFLTTFTFSISAQIPGIPANINSTSTEQEITKKILEQKKLVIEQILLDVEKLELPKDRAWALAETGKYLCKIDKPRAEKLFERSINEFYAAKAKAEIVNDEKSFEIIYGGYPRTQIIQNINDCDSELAYEYLLKTRPQNLSEFLNSFYQNPFYSTLDQRVRGTVSWEFSRETNLKSEIIRTKPERAEEFINHDLNTFISNQTLKSIETLSRSKPSLANNLAESAVEKLLKTQFYNPLDKKTISFTYPSNFQIASSFLEAFGDDSKNNWSKLKISDDNLVKLADKLAKDAIDSKSEWIYVKALNVVKRLVPDRYAQFEQMKEERSKTPEAIESKRYSKLIKNNPSSETILSNAKNFSEKYQTRIQKFAACTLVKEERFTEAESLLKDASGEDILSHEFSLVIYSNVLRYIRNKQYERAETATGKMPDAHLQIDALAFLAEEIYKQNPKENKQKALLLLSKAEKLLDSTFETISEALALSDIIPVYTLIDPEKAFQKFDSLIRRETENSLKSIKSTKKLKETGILALISFVGIRNVQSYDLIVSRLNSQNFDRTLSIINKIKLPESRISVKLNLLETDFLDMDFRNEVFEQCNP